MNNRLKYGIVAASTCVVIVLLLGAVYGQGTSSSDDSYKHLEVYTEVLHRIQTDYVEEPNLKNVTLGALSGMLESIDPYASYLNPDQYKQYLQSKDEGKADTGLIMSKRFGYVGVIDSLPGSSAAKAGLVTGDVIETIAGASTRDMPLASAEMAMHGAPGSGVELGILRFRNPQPETITLNRTMIADVPAAAKMLPDQVGLVTVAMLEPGAVKEIAAKVDGLQKQGAQRLVLDLRNCADGSPDEGIQLANLFMDHGLIAYLQGQKVPRQDFNASAETTVSRLPLAVVVNRGTADGAEIAAAALLDAKRAEVVGEKTYGDAAVRRAIPMNDGSAVILSVAKYYSPSGKSIQDDGVTPSVPVAESSLTAGTLDTGIVGEQGVPSPGGAQLATRTEDLLLKKAVEVVSKGSVK